MEPAALNRPWLRFRVRGIEYALPLDVVSEVTAARSPRLIPFVPLSVGGVVNAKGEPLPTVNGGRLLQNLPTRAQRHALVLERGTVRLGLLVDAVARIEPGLGRAAQEGEEPPEQAPSGPSWVRWVTVNRETVGLVDPDALIDSARGLLTTPHTQRGEEQWRNAF